MTLHQPRHTAVFIRQVLGCALWPPVSPVRRHDSALAEQTQAASQALQAQAALMHGLVEEFRV